MTKKKSSGSKPRVSMAKCRDRVAWLSSKLGRAVKPQDVVNDAQKNTDSAYHKWFTWNLKSAAKKRWLDEARRLLGRIKVIYYDATGNAVSARKYINLIQEQPATHRLVRGYVERPTVLGNVDLKRQCVEQARKELETWKARWKTFTEIEVTFSAIDAVIVQLQKTRFKKIAGGKVRKSTKQAK